MFPIPHPQQNRVRILFDVSRLIRTLHAGGANYGIDTYTASLPEGHVIARRNEQLGLFRCEPASLPRPDT